jgi:hypothetical protein
LKDSDNDADTEEYDQPLPKKFKKADDRRGKLPAVKKEKDSSSWKLGRKGTSNKLRESVELLNEGLRNSSKELSSSILCYMDKIFSDSTAHVPVTDNRMNEPNTTTTNESSMFSSSSLRIPIFYDEMLKEAFQELEKAEYDELMNDSTKCIIILNEMRTNPNSVSTFRNSPARFRKAILEGIVSAATSAKAERNDTMKEP